MCFEEQVQDTHVFPHVFRCKIRSRNGWVSIRG